MVGQVALGAVQMVSVVKTMRTGSFISSKIDAFRRDKEPYKSNVFHHPIAYPLAATMTAARERYFPSTKKPKANEKATPGEKGA